MLPTEDDRLKYAIYHLDKMIPMLKETELMKKRIQMNGHFKNIDPPDVSWEEARFQVQVSRDKFKNESL